MRKNNFRLFLARKLSLSDTGRRSSPAVKVAVTAVALSVTVMLASIAIVKGFKKEITSKLVGFNSHLTIYQNRMSEDETGVITLTPTLREILDSQEYLEEYHPETSIPAVIKTESDFQGVYLKGVPSESDLGFIADNLEAGRMPKLESASGLSEIVISQNLSDAMRIDLNDDIEVYFISDDIRLRKLRVTGIFDTHFDAYDDLYVYGSIDLVREIAGMKQNQTTLISATVKDMDHLVDDTISLNDAFRKAYLSDEIYSLLQTENVLYYGAAYFRWLSLLDTNVIVVLLLMLAVAAVTLISGMMIIILDKIRLIGILRSLGARSADIRSIFLYLTMRVAITGMIIGNLITLLFIYLQDRHHIVTLDPEAYYIDFVPVDISWTDILWLNAGIMAVIFLILIIPSYISSRISPVEALRERD